MSQLIKKINETINKNKLTEYMLIDLSNKILRRSYKKGEKIDIVFIFQSASFWPSWETLWEACKADNRINATMLLSDEEFKEKTQFKTAKKFLKKNNINFKHISTIDIYDIDPHVILLHTPYDGHRPRYLHGKQLSSKGYRTAYITYGIEISDTERARGDHFLGGVTTSAWRIYTATKEMIPYYKMFSPTGGDMVRSFGHPKFDYLNKESFPTLPEYIKEKINGRKVLLLKVHFPKKVNNKWITPSIEMYEKFIDSLSMYKNLFCIFMPHPKFYEALAKYKNIDKFKDRIERLENIIEYTDDDYRPVLINCDYYIVDRSSLMIEAGVTDKPILYISTKIPEKMTIPIQKVIDSYYQASTGKEIVKFIDEVVIPEKDPLQESRGQVFREVIPNMKGKSGYLIKEDIVNSLINENKKYDCSRLVQDSFKELITDLYAAKDTKEAKIEIERQKIKNHLSYRLGKVMIESSRKPFGFIKLPWELRKAYNKFKAQKL